MSIINFPGVLRKRPHCEWTITHVNLCPVYSWMLFLSFAYVIFTTVSWEERAAHFLRYTQCFVCVKPKLTKKKTVKICGLIFRFLLNEKRPASQMSWEAKAHQVTQRMQTSTGPSCKRRCLQQHELGHACHCSSCCSHSPFVSPVPGRR